MAKKETAVKQETKNACLSFYNSETKKEIEHIFECDEIGLVKKPIWNKEQRGVLDRSFIKINVYKGEEKQVLVIGATGNNLWVLPETEIREQVEVKRYK